ncbi:MAG: hypothetical protein BJ554DRAFT_7936 [Olpidium bornovanus]|uniref:Uncharacterized protein n=1 Tax=Olpidium bornovanus TaxID=278681 RepID=A0A8H7ZVH0_9FUNG|nr:MAG: hypothetical protein BJ554DRAFT_7936 [Olpidium bornovanus]
MTLPYSWLFTLMTSFSPAPDFSLIESTKQALDCRFPLTDQAIKPTGSTVLQSHYIDQLRTAFHHSACHPESTPLGPSAFSSLDVRRDNASKLLGPLINLSTRTRPDIATDVGFLARFMSNPPDSHWSALKSVLRYLSGTL